jgi:hypothetical protein
MPLPGTTVFPRVPADNAGVLAGTILRGGKEYHGKMVTLISPPLLSKTISTSGQIVLHHHLLCFNCRLLVELGVKAAFKEVSFNELLKRMEGTGFPRNLVVAVTELSEALPLETELMQSKEFVQGSDVSSSSRWPVIPRNGIDMRIDNPTSL